MEWGGIVLKGDFGKDLKSKNMILAVLFIFAVSQKTIG